MELPQSHDFLPACSNNSSTVQPDPMPSSQSGGYLKTQDFLQPLERVGKRACVKEGIRSRVDTTTSKSPQLLNQHVLPGGIGTYTISHIPYSYHHHQRAPKSEVSHMFTVPQAISNERHAADENSVSSRSSYAASGFTLWDESVGKKGHTRKENARARTNTRDAAETMEQWQRIEQRNSSLQETTSLNIQSQSFMDMIRSAKGSSQKDDLDDDDRDEFVMNNTSTSHCQRVDLRVKVDENGHGNEQKPNTPRSKHSATEQRRRSKINDRFQMLRKLIPNSDQKRDKASFLLEVIEYIHFLQEKVDKHEMVVPYHGELMNWRNQEQPPEGIVPVLAEAEEVNMDDQCLNRAMETVPVSMLGQRNSFSPPATPLLCPVLSDAAVESEKLSSEEEEEEFSVHMGTISISSAYSQGLLKTLTDTLQTSGVDLSKASITVQIKFSNTASKQKDEEANAETEKKNSIKNI